MDEPPLSVTLTDPATGTTADILVGLGLNCYSFRPVFDGKTIEVLWSHPEFASGVERPSGSGIPLMFPFPGRLRGKNLQYEGETFDLNSGDVMGNAIHGYVIDRPWRVIEQEPARLIAQFQASIDDAERFACWPADYRLTATYAVQENALVLDMLVENPSADYALPFGIGTHPYFRVPLNGVASDRCNVRVPASRYWELVDMLPSGRTLACDHTRDLRAGALFGQIQLDDVLTDLTANAGRVVTEITDDASGRTMAMAFDDSFGQCVVYTPPNREAICIEPITSVPNAYELAETGVETGLRVLDPGGTYQANIEIRVA